MTFENWLINHEKYIQEKDCFIWLGHCWESAIRTKEDEVAELKLRIDYLEEQLSNLINIVCEGEEDDQ